MQIEINSKGDFFNINVPDKVDTQELNELIFTLQGISKMFSRDVLKMVKNVDVKKIDTTTGKRTYKRRQHHNWKNPIDSREKAIELLKLHYYGTKEDRKQFISDFNFYSTWDDLSKSFWTTRNKYKIMANEVGLFMFPAKGNSDKEKCKKPGYKFKYNSAVFKK